MRELYFENVITVGNLYLEHIFLEYCKEPVFFTCVDENGQMYICLCSEIRGGQKWVISKCGLGILQALVDGQLAMCDAFRIDTRVYIVTRDISGNEESSVLEIQNLDSLDLPREGVMLKCNKVFAKNYIVNKQFAELEKSIEELIEKKTNSFYDMVFEAPSFTEIKDMFLSQRDDIDMNIDMSIVEYTETAKIRYAEHRNELDIEVNESELLAAS